MSIDTLYKYVGPDRTDILEGNRIRFSQSSALNDPLEMRPYFADVARDNDAIERVKGPERERVLREAYQGMIRINPAWGATWPTVDEFLSEAMLKPDLVDDVISNSTLEALQHGRADMATTRARHAEIVDSEAGVLSLSEDPLNLLMWPHYAVNHTGIVIGFNANHPWMAEARQHPVGFDHLGTVTYTQNRPQYDYLSDVTMTDLFFHKSSDWAYEREWRMVRRLSDADAVVGGAIHLFDVPSESVSSVILGCLMEDAPKRRVWAALQSSSEWKHVQVFQAAVEEKAFALRIDLASPL